MARVTHIKKAQQRYAMVDVLAADGKPINVPVMDRSTGKQKVTKRGTPVTRRLTREDKKKPLPLLVCEKCGKNIEIGTPYQWVAPRSGPFGGYKRYRHESCPTWRQSELSSAKTAAIMEAQEDFDAWAYDNKEDLKNALSEVAQVVRDVAEEYSSSADAAGGLGVEWEDKASELESAADDLEQALDATEDEPEACDNHAEEGLQEPGECDDCDEQRDDWLEELRSTADEAVNSIEY